MQDTACAHARTHMRECVFKIYLQFFVSRLALQAPQKKKPSGLHKHSQLASQQQKVYERA